ncbi:peptide ABC transporter ATPase [Defluviimonas sp. 20V17]|uniref:ATP-binding cassette, subfamily C n=1 Tax=Allgaiera indica TaxID=765699 RepID=A0AAN4ZXX6_9RHOB|nr:type I secretion system permease/ATPase [Allgaiera indica]KDB04738.1 peptide ABC transporter ATPase [Defluviimonas sp. 20V17]GHD99118.1 protease/lipase ABC transporter permease/ATP-binding protein [Allgaiera indica]SDW00342.1 ATP-binding cassette, subfamily C [Allgaiera indica]
MGLDRNAFSAGRAELAHARRAVASLIGRAALFGTFANLLLLAGPLYMLQVYDRVLGARSEETLVALSLLLALCYLIMAVLDHARARLTARAGALLHDRLGGRIFDAQISRAAVAADDRLAQGALRDLDALRMVMGAPVLMALFDLLWTPLFLAAIFVFHPLLGWAALGGCALLIALAALNQATTRALRHNTAAALDRANRLADALRAEAPTARALGLTAFGRARWHHDQEAARDDGLRLSDRHALFASATRGGRLFLQSALLGIGAWLVLRDALTPGAMIATSVLMGRALAPVEQVIGQWALLQRASRGWRQLALLLTECPGSPAPMPLPAPEPRLQVEQLTVVPPGARAASLRMLSLSLEPGQALGVIGPSGAGKSTLARALAGIWPAAAGSIRLGGTPIGLFPPAELARHLGYLPQQVPLFEGTVAENIARLDPTPDAKAVVAAARRAFAHEMILSLPQGYDTPLGPGGAGLSGGQIQRIGLARALFGDPVLLILDEPNANLDNDGSEAMNAVIRDAKARGRVVLVMAHRPAAIRDCDRLLVLDGGQMRALGPPDQVLRAEVGNHAEVLRAATPGGVA